MTQAPIKAAVAQAEALAQEVGADIASVLITHFTDAETLAAVAAGATLMRPIFDVPHVGRIAILSEPGGAGIGWMTPAS